MPVEDALKMYTEGSPTGFHVHVQLLKKHGLVNYTDTDTKAFVGFS
jgi:hypothetical protein